MKAKRNRLTLAERVVIQTLLQEKNQYHTSLNNSQEIDLLFTEKSRNG